MSIVETNSGVPFVIPDRTGGQPELRRPGVIEAFHRALERQTHSRRSSVFERARRIVHRLTQNFQLEQKH